MQSEPIGIQLKVTGKPETGGGATLAFTEAAVRKIRHYTETLDEARGKLLRIFVQGGGCSGFEYGFTFDEQQQDDTVIEQDGVKVLVDSSSLPYLQGAVVDFSESLMSSGFSVQNPNATASCGCGHSFSV